MDKKQKWKLERLNELFVGITFFGSYAFYFITLLFFYFINVELFQLVLIGFFIIQLVGGGIKLFWFKERPVKQGYHSFFTRVDASAWPSVHSWNAIFLAFAYSMIYEFVLLKVFVFVFAGLVCYSRIYLRKHDWKDVLAGFSFGVILSYLLYFV